MKPERIILGIDPGTNLLGYGIIKTQHDKIALLASGVIDLSKFEDHYIKLQKIFERTLHLIEHFFPDELAIEAPFYGKNVQSMLKLGRAQGVAMAAGLYRSLPIFEYSPRKVKQAITGNGNASKEQVAAIIKGLLAMNELPEHLDTSDAIAVAVCHFYQKKVITAGKSFSSWSDFIKQNPQRIGQ